MKAKRIRRYVVAALLMIFITAIWFVFIDPKIQASRDFYKGYQHSLDEYRELATAQLLRDYMKANDQRWPSDWDDLEEFYENSDRRYVYLLEGQRDFGELPDRIEIDFSFDPASVIFPDNAVMQKHWDRDYVPPFRVALLGRIQLGA